MGEWLRSRVVDESCVSIRTGTAKSRCTTTSPSQCAKCTEALFRPSGASHVVPRGQPGGGDGGEGGGLGGGGEGGGGGGGPGGAGGWCRGGGMRGQYVYIPRGELQPVHASFEAWHGESSAPNWVHWLQSSSPVGSGSSGTRMCSRQQRPVPGGGGDGEAFTAGGGRGGGAAAAGTGQPAGCSSQKVKLPHARQEAAVAWHLSLGLVPKDVHEPHWACGAGGYRQHGIWRRKRRGAIFDTPTLKINK